MIVELLATLVATGGGVRPVTNDDYEVDKKGESTKTLKPGVNVVTVRKPGRKALSFEAGAKVTCSEATGQKWLDKKWAKKSKG